MQTKTYGFSALALAATAGLWWSAAGQPPAPPAEPLQPMSDAVSAVSLPPDYALEQTARTAGTERMTVYKSPACGCCGAWIEHLREHGFTIDVEETQTMGAVKQMLHVSSELASCHTGVIAGRVVEGHVPADAIRAFLASDELADAVGLAVPGMPMGSPGMEVEGRPADAYDILAFQADGGSEVFESR
jgi:hypothetical protein